MGTQDYTPLRVLFLPFMAPGHMLPLLDIAKLFAARGVRCTVLTTPGNAALMRSSSLVERHSVEILLVPFPSVAAGLPDGCENLYSVPSPELEPNFYKAMAMLREPFSQLLAGLLPDCVVADMFMPWAYHAADKLHIPTLLFTGLSFFAHCCFASTGRPNFLDTLPAEEDPFVIPGLPHTIKMFKSQIVNLAADRPELFEIIMATQEVEARCYGLLMNTFHELEPDYAEHYREVVGRRAWHLGPVSLCNSDTVEKSSRGNINASSTSSSEEEEGGYRNCLSWLDERRCGSVVYVCFGGSCHFSTAQLCEIALGLEAASHPFVWVVRRDEEGSIPRGYEKRVEGKGLVIRGWAPQILILNHDAVGGFVTHCGWNSTLEGVSAGLPLVTWPQYADQSFNERLVVDVLKIGVAIGVKRMVAKHEEKELVEAARIEMAIQQLMGDGEDAEERRRRARKLGEMARKAVDEGGSSYVDMDNLIHELEETRTEAILKGARCCCEDYKL